MMMIKFRESQHPVFRAMSVLCPEERSKAEEVKNYQYISSMMVGLKIFRTITSDNKLSIYGAVSDLTE